MFDPEFEALLAHMRQQRQFEAAAMGIAIFLAGMGAGAVLIAWMVGLL